jgi:dihydroorotate dehydrogenase
LSGLYELAKPLIFALDAERVHRLTLSVLARYPALVGLPAVSSAPPVQLMGLSFKNRIGLAAGLDKNGECVEAFERMGFGFIEVGTVTPRPQPGNPRPRMFRIPQRGALINRLGFNNDGVDALVARLKDWQGSARLGINIGKNADTPIERAHEDYLICLQKVYARADYVTVNISSPNTVGLRDLQQRAQLEIVLATLRDARPKLADMHQRQVPLLVKIAPDVDEATLTQLAESAIRFGMDGLIATNTTIARDGVDGLPNAAEVGGLSGRPLRKRASKVLQRLRAIVGPSFPLVGVGGIDSATTAMEKRNLGADLVQIYTGLIYQGPALVRECANALARAD